MYKIPVVFQFKVEVAGFNGDDTLFQEVTGLSAEVTTEELKEGGLNTHSHRLPTGVKFGNLVLKRGMFKDSAITKWCRKAIEEFTFEAKDVKVTLLDEKNEGLVSWSFKKAYPIKWSISDFKAQDNALVIESIEMAYQSFVKDK